MGTIRSFQHRKQATSASSSLRMSRPGSPHLASPVRPASPPSLARPIHTPPLGHSFATLELFPSPGASSQPLQRQVDKRKNLPPPPGEVEEIEEEEEKEEEPAIQRAVTAPSAGISEPLGIRLQAAKNRGQSPETPVRQRLERGLGYDLSRIRIHTDREADHLSRSVGALAFTSGSDIFFRSGMYRPSSAQGFHLLAHEVAHVVQQRHGVYLKGGIGQVGDPYERQADAVADQVSAGRSAEALLDRSSAGLAEPHRAESNVDSQRWPIQRVLTGSGGPSVASGAPPAPSLSTKKVTGTGQNDNGPCGAFTRTRQWIVNNPVQGVIIQHVTRTFNVDAIDPKSLTTTKMNAGDIDSYVNSSSSSAYATETEYWELWEVAADGTVSDGGQDLFSLCAIIPAKSRRFKNTTKGTFTMRGEAQFYPITADPTTFGFAKRAVNAAGGLYSTTTDPTAGLSVAPVGSAVTYQADVRWDSTFVKVVGSSKAKKSGKKARSPYVVGGKTKYFSQVKEST
jgi:hypothetical protein